VDINPPVPRTTTSYSGAISSILTVGIEGSEKCVKGRKHRQTPTTLKEALRSLKAGQSSGALIMWIFD
jgi:hypothetical protein